MMNPHTVDRFGLVLLLRFNSGQVPQHSRASNGTTIPSITAALWAAGLFILSPAPSLLVTCIPLTRIFMLNNFL